MRERVAHLLRCPIDGSPLDLIVWKDERHALNNDDRSRALDLGLETDLLERWIESGVLVSRGTNLAYPIHAGIPRLLTFETAVVDQFWAEHRSRIARELPGVDRPRQGAPPGEVEILRSFSTEWNDYEWNGDRYWSMTRDAWFAALELLMDIDFDAIPNRVGLEVGIGIGGLSDHLAREQGIEIVGVDLGYAVDGALAAFGDNPFFHIVQASAFALPFESRTFGVVCSFGVLHHTWSTEAAFQSVSRTVAPRGQLFIWVYSPLEAASTGERRSLIRLEEVVRPIVTRLPTRVQTLVLAPAVPVYMIRQRARVRSGTNDYASYRWGEALHAARDRLTPRFAHRHSEEEVRQWFVRSGFENVVGNTRRAELTGLPDPLRLSTGVKGTRSA
ncbi:MAG: methyltransferase domain-containing protein [Actinobacteria bacterium]|nr:methyltransferase domain-containing protein [Actinomycetota bacterium]